MKRSSPEGAPRPQELNTNNFWHRFAAAERENYGEDQRQEYVDGGLWTEEKQDRFEEMNKFYTEIDRIAANLGIDVIAAVQTMQQAIALVHSGKSEESKVVRQQAEQQLAPLFEALVQAGYDPKDLMS